MNSQLSGSEPVIALKDDMLSTESKKFLSFRSTFQSTIASLGSLGIGRSGVETDRDGGDLVVRDGGRRGGGNLMGFTKRRGSGERGEPARGGGARPPGGGGREAGRQCELANDRRLHVRPSVDEERPIVWADRSSGRSGGKLMVGVEDSDCAQRLEDKGRWWLLARNVDEA